MTQARNKPGSNRAAFLDRDGTIIEDPGYLNDPAQLKLLDGAAGAIARLRREGFYVIVATNQSAIARGMLTEAGLAEIHARLSEMLAAEDPDAVLDGIYVCPYHPQATVSEYRQESYLRKPRPGMLFKAAREFQLDLGSCWMVGDRERDVQAGKTAGCRAILLGDDPDCETMGDAVCPTLADAVEVMLASPGRAPLRSPTAEPEESPEPAALAESDPPPLPRSPDPGPSKPQVAAAVEPEPSEPQSAAASAEPEEEPQEEPAMPEPTPAAGDPSSPQPARRQMGETRRRLLAQVEQELSERDADHGGDSDEESRHQRDSNTRKLLAEILQQLRQLNRGPDKHEFSATKIIGGLLQAVSWALVALGMVNFWDGKMDLAMVWIMVAIFSQLASLSFFLMHSQD